MIKSDHSKMSAVENHLRYRILIAGDTSHSMTLSDRMAYYKVPGVSIAVINQGKLDWAKGYGNVSFSTSAKNIDDQTLFQAGSISKALNAMGALLLVQKGLLTLDGDVNQYLKSWKIPDNEFTSAEKVTLRRLLSHSAGISVHGFSGYTVAADIPNILNILDGRKPGVNSDPIRVIQKPASVFRYSGGGTTIIQLLIEDITGEKYDSWIQKNILIPLHMNRSSFNQPLTDKQSLLNVACGYHANGEAVEGQWHVYPEMAAAGLWTTPTDLASYMVELFKMLQKQPGILDPALMQEAVTPQIKIENWFSDTISEAMGLGFFLAGNARNLKIAHDGGNEGFIGRFMAFPEEGKGLVIMVNNDAAFSLIDEITYSIADVYSIPGFEAIQKPEILISDKSKYSGFVGTYQCEDEELTISLHHNKLFLSFWYSMEMELHREKEDLFFIQEGSDAVRLMQSGAAYQVNIISSKTEKIYHKMSKSISG